MGSTAPPGLSLVSLLSLLACSLQLAVALLLAQRYGGRSSRADWWVLLWLFYDVIVHLTLVGPIRSWWLPQPTTTCVSVHLSV